MVRIFSIVCLFFILLYAGEENSCDIEDCSCGDPKDWTPCGYDDRLYNKPVADIFAHDSEIIAEYCAEYFEPEKDMSYAGTRLDGFKLTKILKEYIKLQIDTIPELLHCRERKSSYTGGGRTISTELLYMGIDINYSINYSTSWFHHKYFRDDSSGYIYKIYYDTIYLKPPEYIDSPPLLCAIPKKSVENHYGKLLIIKKDFSCEPPYNFDPKYTATFYIRITGECPKKIRKK